MFCILVILILPLLLRTYAFIHVVLGLSTSYILNILFVSKVLLMSASSIHSVRYSVCVFAESLQVFQGQQVTPAVHLRALGPFSVA